MPWIIRIGGIAMKPKLDQLTESKHRFFFGFMWQAKAVRGYSSNLISTLPQR
ncbi:hypothetical protein [Nostoc sp. FACHB-133]|uniref:hypothetical protein n=1 Tax=Nostoc sp. FACHB-133 TaxID=2692835 RepID=UPI0016864560|nr:hypothetical protein [Nostoc sp. FACHB-133]MBD2527868.1 hypothetical protein [Nostoc sp. FACHB-133]